MALFFYILSAVITILTWLVIIQVVLSYFMSPYHVVRQTVDRLVNPLLEPIRRLLPRTGMMDFSPMILLVLLQLLRMILGQLFLSF